MSVVVALTRTAAFTVLYLLATVAGRLTVMDDSNLSLVWPAAGVAVLWFCAQRRSPYRLLDGAALALVTVVVNMATGATAPMAAVFVVANLAQAGIFVHLIGRWRPDLWGAGGTAPLSRSNDLWALLGAAFAATTVGAAIGPTGIWLITGEYSWPSTGVWLARNTASMLIIGAAGLRLGYELARHRSGSWRGWWHQVTARLRRTPAWRIGEYAAVAVCSVVVYLIGFAYNHGLPLAFPLIAVTVWAALRLSTTFVVLHDLAVGTIAVVFTLGHVGPFAAIGSNAARAIVAQVFVGMVAVVGLALALGRDERAALIGELAREKDEASRRADLTTAIIDAMADGLSVIDAEGRVVLRNPAAVELLGGRAGPGGTVTGGTHYGLFHPDGRPIADHELPYHRAMAGDDVAGVDLLVRNPGVPDGRIVSVTATTLPDGPGSRRAVVLFHDVTAERRQREELTNFAGVVAHDLLNPLTAVEGWTEATGEALRDAPRHPAVGEATDSLARVSRAAARMRELINDLLAYSTARDAAVAAVRADLNDVVRDIATARVDAAVAAGTPVPEFVLDDLDPVLADVVLTRQLLDNLIGNAVKYTAPGVRPRIVVSCARAGDRVEVTVADNGIGIPAGQHEAIFGNFHRAHHGSGYSGTGLGLAICRRIVERHGGTIRAADAPGGGSRFTFTLPAAEPVRVPV
jgi:signal transduction histidine kinase